VGLLYIFVAFTNKTSITPFYFIPTGSEAEGWDAFTIGPLPKTSSSISWRIRDIRVLSGGSSSALLFAVAINKGVYVYDEPSSYLDGEATFDSSIHDSSDP
jgi:hypothetical protein